MGREDDHYILKLRISQKEAQTAPMHLYFHVFKSKDSHAIEATMLYSLKKCILIRDPKHQANESSVWKL